jgi:NAD(P)-dependent dehydrogenase (short-subunit alcohol dehydrogenase family)
VSSLHSIVIGGTKGVGREVALLFAEAGRQVTVVGRTAASFDGPSGRRIESIAGDVGDVEPLLGKLIKRVEARGGLSSLVFLQRYRGHGDSWTGEIAVSLSATRSLVEGLAPYFSAEGDRSICMVSSNASSFVARNQTVAYHAAKAALKQMARFYAVKYGPQGIRVNVVSPCTFVKPESAEYFAQQESLRALYGRITPLGRMGTAKEVARAVAFLCGPDASFITGQDLTVDGGLSLMLQDTLAREIAGIAG